MIDKLYQSNLNRTDFVCPMCCDSFNAKNGVDIFHIQGVQTFKVCPRCAQITDPKELIFKFWSRSVLLSQEANELEDAAKVIFHALNNDEFHIEDRGDMDD